MLWWYKLDSENDLEILSYKILWYHDEIWWRHDTCTEPILEPITLNLEEKEAKKPDKITEPTTPTRLSKSPSGSKNSPKLQNSSQDTINQHMLAEMKKARNFCGYFQISKYFKNIWNFSWEVCIDFRDITTIFSNFYGHLQRCRINILIYK